MGSFAPFGINMRRYEPMQIGPRPPVSAPLASASSATDTVNSLRRLNDSTPDGPPSGFALIWSVLGKLYVDSTLVATGFSSNRKSLASFRPDASVQPWMYVGDSVKAVKVNANGTVYATGIAEPQTPATTQLSGKQFSKIWDANSIDHPFGTAATGLVPDPVSAAYSAILWDYGDQGEGSIVVATAGILAEQCLLTTDESIVYVQKILSAPANSTIVSVVMDDPLATSGLCIVGIAGTPALVQGSIYQTSTMDYFEVIGHPWVQGVNTYFHSNVLAIYSPGEVLTGIAGLRCLVPFTIPQTGTLLAHGDAMSATNPSGGFYSSTIRGVGESQGRLIQDTDKIHVVVKADTPANITNVVILFNLDPNTNDFTQNALRWTIAGGSFTGVNYLNLSLLVSSLTRIGTNINLSLATGVTAIKITATLTGPCNFVFQEIHTDGNYGPTGSGSNAPISYRYIYRSTATGAKSNPSPLQRTSINPTAAGIWVHPIDNAVPADPQVDVLDWFRIGGTLLNYTYVGTANIINGVIEPFLDDNDDLTVANNPLLEFDNFEPFPSIDLPQEGLCSVNQHTVTRASGGPFNVRWAPGTLIVINGVTYHLYNRPQDASTLTILENGGLQAGLFGVTWKISQPTLLAQRLPTLWGPTDNTGFFFSVGDPLRPGTLYFTKGNNPDSAPDTNQIEVTSPSEPLMNGCILNGLGMVFSTERAWWIYPQFANVLATIVGTIGSPFYLIETISNRGLFARHGICTDGGGRVFFISKDGIYESAGGPGKCITDIIYTLFPHEGGPQQPQSINGTFVFPPDYDNPEGMSLAFVDNRLYFDYLSEAGGEFTLVYDIYTGMWSQDFYTTNVSEAGLATVHAPNEGPVIGTLIGFSGGLAVAATIREFDPTGTEPVTMVIQPDFQSYENKAWQHIKELNAEYQCPSTPATLQLIPDQGATIASIPIPTAGSQIKSLLMVPAPNKFKLVQFILVSTDDQFRMWADGWEVKIGPWGRVDEYQIVKPFLRFGVNAGGG